MNIWYEANEFPLPKSVFVSVKANNTCKIGFVSIVQNGNIQNYICITRYNFEDGLSTNYITKNDFCAIEHEIPLFSLS